MAIRQFTPSPYAWRNRVMIKFLASDYWWNKASSTELAGGRTVSNTTGSNLIQTHLRENVNLLANTTFQSLIEMSPIGSALETLSGATSAVFGQALGGVAKYMQMETWKSTDPLSFGLTLHFDTDMNPRNDVFLPTIALFAYTVPEENRNKILKTPGPNILALLSKSNSMNTDKVNLAGTTVSSSSEDRLVSILIGGWLYLTQVVLVKAEPTFSKDLTESGYPLWSELTCEFKALRTCTVDHLTGLADDAQSQAIANSQATNTIQ